MTGTLNSNILTGIGTLALWTAVAAPDRLAADEIFLEGAEHLSGSVRAISENGSVLLESPLSPEVVSITPNSVRKVVFSDQPGKPGVTSHCVTLANGDVLPGTIESVDDKSLTIASSTTGRVVIPRNMVYSLQLGIHQPNVIYAGPDGLAGWVREQTNADRWTFSDGVFHVRGPGMISREFNLPQQFIVRFNLTWDNSPNIRFYFASAINPEKREQDRYFLQFSDAGLEIKRESSVGRHYTTITTLNRLPKQYSDKLLAIEIRVDRSANTLQLLLNDEPEGPFKDPVAKAPVAGGICFESIAGSGANIGLGNIQVLDWNLKSERRRTEERGDATKDALIGIKSERFSGQLLETRKGADGMLYVFKNAFQDEPLEVPETEISTIFFAGKKEASAGSDKTPFTLMLRGGGSLHVSACEFSADQVAATHPLLGKVMLQRDGVSSFERAVAKPKEDKEP